MSAHLGDPPLSPPDAPDVTAIRTRLERSASWNLAVFNNAFLGTFPDLLAMTFADRKDICALLEAASRDYLTELLESGGELETICESYGVTSHE